MLCQGGVPWWYILSENLGLLSERPGLGVSSPHPETERNPQCETHVLLYSSDTIRDQLEGKTYRLLCWRIWRSNINAYFYNVRRCQWLSIAVQQMFYKWSNVKNSLCAGIPSKWHVSLKSENTGWTGLWTSLCFSDLTAIQSEGKNQAKEEVC